MYRGFNLTITDKDFEDLKKDEMFRLGTISGELFNKSVEDGLQKYLIDKERLDGDAIMDNWFPNVNADIFISHSHNDLDKATALMGYFIKFGLFSFVDSYVWKHSDKLLKLLDNKLCYNEDRNTYDYGKRNQTTSHVHMMLATALTQMMDKCECLFFLNTPNSVNPKSAISDEVYTHSPWLFHEISTFEYIRKKRRTLKYAADSSINFSFDEADTPKIVHTLKMENLVSLTYDDLKEWHRESKYEKDKLAVLYNKFPLPSGTILG